MRPPTGHRDGQDPRPDRRGRTGRRDAMADLVASDPAMDVVGTARDADEAIQVASVEKPDVALIDVKMPGGGGPRAAREIRKESPQTQVIALSAYEDRRTVLEILRAGVVGYVVKGTSAEERSFTRRGRRGRDAAGPRRRRDRTSGLGLRERRPAAGAIRGDTSRAPALGRPRPRDPGARRPARERARDVAGGPTGRGRRANGRGRPRAHRRRSRPGRSRRQDRGDLRGVHPDRLEHDAPARAARDRGCISRSGSFERTTDGSASRRGRTTAACSSCRSPRSPTRTRSDTAAAGGVLTVDPAAVQVVRRSIAHDDPEVLFV
jgi:CheY-like chemotaxis protein